MADYNRKGADSYKKPEEPEKQKYLKISRGGQGDLPPVEVTPDDLDEVRKQLRRASRVTGERLSTRINM